MTKKAFIKVIGPTEAQDKILQRAYKRIGGGRGAIAHVHQSQSLNPKAMMAHLDLYMAIMYQLKSRTFLVTARRRYNRVTDKNPTTGGYTSNSLFASQ